MTEETKAGQTTPGTQAQAAEPTNGAPVGTTAETPAAATGGTPAEAAAPAQSAPPREQASRREAPESVDRLSLRDLKPGMTVTGTVKNIAQFGAFIDIGAEQDGLVHISELSEDRVRRVEDVVKTGQQVEVTVLDVDPRRKRISLSMKPRYDADEYSTPGDDDAFVSPIALAFQRAQQKRQEREERSKSSARDKSLQDDILSRTLRQHKDRK